MGNAVLFKLNTGSKWYNDQAKKDTTLVRLLNTSTIEPNTGIKQGSLQGILSTPDGRIRSMTITAMDAGHLQRLADQIPSLRFLTAEFVSNLCKSKSDKRWEKYSIHIKKVMQDRLMDYFKRDKKFSDKDAQRCTLTSYAVGLFPILRPDPHPDAKKPNHTRFFINGLAVGEKAGTFHYGDAENSKSPEAMFFEIKKDVITYHNIKQTFTGELQTPPPYRHLDIESASQEAAQKSEKKPVAKQSLETSASATVGLYFESPVLEEANAIPVYDDSSMDDAYPIRLIPYVDYSTPSAPVRNLMRVEVFGIPIVEKVKSTDDIPEKGVDKTTVLAIDVYKCTKIYRRFIKETACVEMFFYGPDSTIAANTMIIDYVTIKLNVSDPIPMDVQKICSVSHNTLHVRMPSEIASGP